MNILSIGGGPAGLYFGILMKKHNPSYNVTIIERNKPYDTFGWGVVFSDATMEKLKEADEQSALSILNNFHHWTDIDIFFKGEKRTSGGHGFVGIGRKKLLNLLQDRCLELGVNLIFETSVEDDDEYIKKYNADLVIAADGLNSFLRTKYQDTYKPDIDVRKCRFVWLGTKKIFNAFTFLFEKTQYGWFQVHAYQFDDTTSTFIVETRQETWEKAGIEKMSKEEAIGFCEKIFAKYLDGHSLISNANHLRGSAIWIQFPRVICENWAHFKQIDGKEVPIILMGDAVHTAHYSIGSGTKLALEDAILLANVINNNPNSNIKEVLPIYEKERKIEVERVKNAARNSTEWFEQVDIHSHMDVDHFAYSCLTRSQRISHDNLKLRDKDYIEQFQKAISGDKNKEPYLMSYKNSTAEFKTRLVDFVDLSKKSNELTKNTSGVVSYPVAVSDCGKMNKTDTTASELTKDSIKSYKDKGLSVSIQLTHWGRKSSLETIYAPSPIAYGENKTPNEISLESMNAVKDFFVSSAKNVQNIGADNIVIDASNGGLLSSFLSPLSNKRKDQYGGDIHARMTYLIEVVNTVKNAIHIPIWVNLSATDWHPDGNKAEDAVEVAKKLKDNSVSLIVVSTGGVIADESAVYGRAYQTPYSDFIKHSVNIGTLTHGNIKTLDEVNGIIAAARADLCVMNDSFK